ncbi:MAG TPA: hypothetical protein PK691_06210 [Thermomicrobiales bacterium]|nr:hypothetical protein [Thermomicrobiales bacterium]
MSPHRGSILLVALASFLPATAPAAALATPDATPTAITCSVAPREPDAIATLVAAAEPATPIPTGVIGLPVDPTVQTAVQTVVLQAELCAQQGDYERLAALYSDQALQSGAFAEETVPIIPGTPDATPADSAAGETLPQVISAVMLDDGRVLATIARGSTLSQVVLVHIDGQWLLDSGETVIGTTVIDTGTPVGNTIPLIVLQAVITQISRQTESDVATVTITEAEPVEWDDAFLGCPVEGEFAAQVITPGYRIVAQFDGQTYEIHTDLQGNATSC